MKKTASIGFSRAALLCGQGLKRNDKGKPSLICPSCGEKAFVTGSSMVCTGSVCEFVRGGPEDYITAHTGSYRDSVRLIENDGGTLEGNVEEVSYELKKQRELLEFFLRLENARHSSDAERLHMRLKASQTGCDPELLSAAHLYTTSEETGELFGLLSNMDITCPPYMSGPLIIIPYWAEPHVLSSFHFFDRRGKIGEITVNASLWSWFGLTHVHPGHEEVEIRTTPQEAMRASERHLSLRTGLSPVLLKVDPTAEIEGWVPEKMIFCANFSDWLKCLPAWSHVKGFHQSFFRENEEQDPKSFLQLIKELFHKNRDEISFYNFADSCEAMQIPPETRNEILDYVFKAGTSENNRILREALSRRLLQRGKKESLYEKSDGYEIEKSSGVSRVTNFLMQLKEVVAFSSAEELHYSGDLVIGDTRVPVTVPGSAFFSPSKFEKIVQPAQLLRDGGSKNDDALSTIFQPTDFKKFLIWMKNEAASLPRRRGVRSLGWTLRGDEFFAPGYVVDLSGYQQNTIFQPDDTSDFHPYAQISIPDKKVEAANSDSQLAGLVSFLLAGVVRMFHGNPVRPRPVKNNIENRNILLSFFQPLGQTNVIRVGNLLPKNINTNRGYPCFLTGLSEHQRKQVNINGLSLEEKGLSLGSNSPDAFSLGSMLGLMTAEISHALITNHDIGYREMRSVSRENSLAKEGASLIRAFYEIDWPEPIERYTNVDRFLEERKTGISDKSSVDLLSGTVEISEDIWKGVSDKQDLLIELGLLCDDVKEENGKLKVDYVSFSNLFEEFHGEKPDFQAAF